MLGLSALATGPLSEDVVKSVEAAGALIVTSTAPEISTGALLDAVGAVSVASTNGRLIHAKPVRATSAVITVTSDAEVYLGRPVRSTTAQALFRVGDCVLRADYNLSREGNVGFRVKKADMTLYQRRKRIKDPPSYSLRMRS